MLAWRRAKQASRLRRLAAADHRAASARRFAELKVAAVRRTVRLAGDSASSVRFPGHDTRLSC